MCIRDRSTIEPITGQSLTSSLGTIVELPDQIVGITGLSITSALGEEATESGADVTVTGIELTASLGSVNITAWSEIDLGVSNTWTEVDLAA